MKASLTGSLKSRAALRWDRVQGILAEQLDRNPARLLEEASYLGLVDDRSNLVLEPRPEHLDPVKALQLLQRAEPSLNLSDLDQNDPYSVAVAVLKMYSMES